MATYDDFDGVYFSVQALRLYHEICKSKEVEIIVIDNNPEGSHGKSIQSFKNWVPNLRYVPFTNKKSTAVRNEIFKNAAGKYTISMDCHVLFLPNAIDSLLEYYSENTNCKNLVQGPMIYDNLNGYATHFKPTWGGDMYGQWDTNKEECEKGEPFDIPMMGLGTFSCETKNWLGFNEAFRGFGGEEGYIHEKFRINGGRSLCLPSFKWIHRFERPNGVKYPLALEDRVWNYFVGWLELHKDPEHEMVKQIYSWFSNRLPPTVIDKIFEGAKQQTNL